MRKAIKIGAIKYHEDRYGVIHQLNPHPFTYDPQYSATYDTPEYRRKSELLQAMRFSFATAVHGKPIQSLLDVGFGNGAFMRFAQRQVPAVYGHDITGVAVPEGCHFTEDINLVCDVITFNDVLEHFPTLGFVKNLKAETLIVSLPFFPGLERFPNWCHRKPDEHIHHFTDESLRKFMWKMGWRMVAKSKHEDIVRYRPESSWNILTMGFKRK